MPLPKQTVHACWQVYGGTAEQLKGFEINISPPKGIWVKVDDVDNIYFKQVGGQQQHRTRFLVLIGQIILKTISWWYKNPANGHEV